MTQVALTGGFYVAKSIIANAQRCCNLYAEKNPPDSPFPFTNYPTPGLTLQLTLPTMPVRGLWTTGLGTLFAVGGNTLYSINSALVPTAVGTIGTSTGPVSMSDNQLVLILVDGSTMGYYVDLTNDNAFGNLDAIAAFYGANHVDIIDTFFIFNQPGTSNWYITTSQIDAALLTGGAVVSGTLLGGYGYSNGVHASVPLTGGSGAGQLADITVSGNQVTNVAIDSGTESAPYQIGDVLSAAAGSPGGLGGGMLNYSIIGGVGYTAGMYSNVAVSGGSGSLATADVTVSAGGAVVSLQFVNPGQDYVVGDQPTISASLIGGTGTGFAINVTGVNDTGFGFTYTVNSVDAGSLAFDPLDIAAKTGSSDLLATLIAVHREAHLFGTRTSEVWYDAGSADFTFGELPGIFYEHGCVAVYSVAKSDLTVFWLGQDKQGQAMVFKEEGYAVKEISTPAIVNVLQTYAVISDAIGFTYQIESHVFYVLTFPTADATWVYDSETQLWHEWIWTDDNGLEHRHRANCQVNAYGRTLVGDWQTGQIYSLDPANATDNGQPIVRRRGFPHILNDGKRLSCNQFLAQMETGTSLGTTEADVQYALTIDTGADALTVDGAANALIIYSSTDNPAPSVSLRCSYFSKGRAFGNPIELNIGAEGEYGRSVQARQLGMGRDWVFELFWSGNYITALNGAYVDLTPSET